jgi:DNA invertase Pin-like site-specific DNA recombinase
MSKPIAVLYARFSGRPNEAGCVSDEMQLERMRRYCDDHGYKIAGEFCETVFVETKRGRKKKGVSGTSLKDRPQLREAMALVKAKRGILVCTKMDRFARSARDTHNLLDELRLRGADLAFTEQDVNTRGPMGKMFTGILALFAEFEAAIISERTRSAMIDHQAGGRRMTRPDKLPYGWQLDHAGPPIVKMDEDGEVLTSLPARMIKHPAEQQVLAMIRRLRKSGLGPRRITHILNQHPRLGRSKHAAIREAYRAAVQLGARALSRTGKRWHLTTVRRLLAKDEELRQVKELRKQEHLRTGKAPK